MNTRMPCKKKLHLNDFPFREPKALCVVRISVIVFVKCMHTGNNTFTVKKAH